MGYGPIAEDARDEVVRFVESAHPGRSAWIAVHVFGGTDRVRTIAEAARALRATLVVLGEKPARATLLRSAVERIARSVHAAVVVLGSQEEAPRE